MISDYGRARAYVMSRSSASSRREWLSIALESVAMQFGAMRVEPALGVTHVRTNALDQPPENSAVVHLDQMRDLVRGEIIEHERRRQNQPPRIGQHAGGRARARSEE